LPTGRRVKKHVIYKQVDNNKRKKNAMNQIDAMNKERSHLL